MKHITKNLFPLLFILFLYGCTSLTPYTEHNKSTSYNFQNLKNVLIYTDYGYISPTFHNQTFMKNILKAFASNGVNTKYYAETKKFDLSNALKIAKESEMDHVIAMGNNLEPHDVVSSGGNYWQKLQIKIINVSSGESLYYGRINMGGQTLNRSAYVKELSKAIVAHLNNPE